MNYFYQELNLENKFEKQKVEQIDVDVYNALDSNEFLNTETSQIFESILETDPDCKIKQVQGEDDVICPLEGLTNTLDSLKWLQENSWKTQDFQEQSIQFNSAEIKVKTKSIANLELFVIDEEGHTPSEGENLHFVQSEFQEFVKKCFK